MPRASVVKREGWYVGEVDRNKRLVLAASCLGFFVAILRATSVNTALPEIRAYLGVGSRGCSGC